MVRLRFSRRLVAPALALATLRCGSGDLVLPGDGEPSEIQVVQGDEQVGGAGLPLQDSIVVRVLDTEGRAVAGLPVAFELGEGASGGHVSPDTVLTDVFVLNWPAGAAVRVIGNSVTSELGNQLFGHDPEALPREAIAWDDDQPRLRFSTDSPLRTTRGDLEAMALFAGQGAGSVHDIVPAGVRLRQMVNDAATCLGRFSAKDRKDGGDR